VHIIVFQACSIQQLRKKSRRIKAIGLLL